MLYSYHKASLQIKIIKRQQKYTIVISIHEVVDGNPMMYKKTFIKLIFFIKKYRGTIKIHYNYNTNVITL